jgi:hypothetical protein
MLTRRQLFHTGLVSGCAACGALATRRLFAASATDASVPSKIEGPGYSLSYLGSQRQTILTGDRAAHLDLRTLQGRPHLYGIGPIQGLTGEVTIADSRPSLARVGGDHLVHVTESYETGVPFFVWAEVSAWQTQEIPDELRTYVELERFVGQAGAKAELTQAFPFVITGRAELIDFHIFNATPDAAALRSGRTTITDRNQMLCAPCARAQSLSSGRNARERQSARRMGRIANSGKQQRKAASGLPKPQKARSETP